MEVFKDFKSLIRKTFKIIRAEPTIIFYAFLLDGFMLLALLLFAVLANNAFPDQNSLLDFLNTANPAAIPVVVVFYLFVLLLIYTFFKYAVLVLIRFRINGDKKIHYSEYLRLLMINIINGLAFFFVLILVGLILLGVKEEVKPFIALIVLTPLLLLLYSFHGLAHSFFLIRTGMKTIYRDSLKCLFSGSVLFLAGAEILVIGVFSAGFYFSGLIFLRNIQSPDAYDKYSLIFTITLLLLLYALISFNRIFVFLLAKENK